MKIKTIHLLLRAPHIVSAIMGLLILFTLMQGLFAFREPVKSTIQSPATTVANSTSTQNISRLIAQIPAWHLLGQAPTALENLAKTSLQLVLNGVMLGKDKTHAYAIISAQGKDQKVYRTGDTLPGGAVLYQVALHGVVIQYNGELQQLPLQLLKSEKK